MRLFAAGFLVCLLASTSADAQNTRPDPYSSRLMLGAESYTWEAVREPAPNMAAARQKAMSRFNAGAGQQAARPRTAATSAGGYAPGQSATATKPFNTVVRSPTLSPYLNLYRTEVNEALPNYHTFVRPQQDQIETNVQQINQLQRLQRQVQQTGYAAPASGSRGAARYGDTAHYYSGWRR